MRREYELDRVLPSEYREVKCIYPNGESWIDTGIYPDTNSDKLEITFKTRSNYSNYGKGIALIIENNHRFGVLEASSAKYLASNGGSGWSSGPNYDKTNIHTAILDAVVKTFILDDVEYSLNSSSLSQDYTFTTYQLTLNRYNGSGSRTNYRWDGEIYSFKYWRNNVIIADYIPVVRNSDNKTGVYDFVNKQFIAPATRNYIAVEL